MRCQVILSYDVCSKDSIVQQDIDHSDCDMLAQSALHSGMLRRGFEFCCGMFGQGRLLWVVQARSVLCKFYLQLDLQCFDGFISFNIIGRTQRKSDLDNTGRRPQPVGSGKISHLPVVVLRLAISRPGFDDFRPCPANNVLVISQGPIDRKFARVPWF